MQSFYLATRRALLFLSQLEFLREFGFELQLSGHNLLKMIDYNTGSIGQLLRLIQAEYGGDDFLYIGENL